MSVNEKMTAIADSIRGYGSITGKLNLDEMANKIGTVYLNGYDLGRVQGEEAGFEEGRKKGYGLGFEEGKIAERDAFWEEYYKTASWAYAFYGLMWNDKNYNPPKTIKPASGTSATAMYQTSTITDTKVPLDLSGVGNINYIFYQARKLKTIQDITFPTSGTASSAFYGCSALENITVSGSIQISLAFNSCTNLKKASIESIVNALSDTTSGLTVTFSETAVNNAFTAEEWEALEATKTNWTISLV